MKFILFTTIRKILFYSPIIEIFLQMNLIFERYFEFLYKSTIYLFDIKVKAIRTLKPKLLMLLIIGFHLTIKAEINSDITNRHTSNLVSDSIHPIFKLENLKPFLANKDYEIQVRYTEIIRDKDGNPSFKTHSWNENGAYFYPASSVKMPVAFAALQKFNEIKKEFPCLSIHDPFITGASQKPQSPDTIHPYSNKKPTLAEHIRLIFAISDNNTYNRLFEFTGQEYINRTHRDKGIFTNSHIIHRVGVGGFSYIDNQFCNPLTIGNKNCHYVQAPFRSIYPFTIRPGSFKGKGYLGPKDSLVIAPFDFTQKNYLSIKDLESCLMRVIFPEQFNENQRYNFTDEDYKFLYKTMDEVPDDIPYLKNNKDYYDTYVKFFYGNGSKETKIPENIHIFNKVGFAYGTLTDCSYIFDTKTGAEFFLTATMLVNKNQIFNDGIYEYDEVGIPFLGKLGMTVLEYEQKKERKYRVDFRKYLGE